ncbi:MAG: hypothetical protein JO354_10715 [Verrucomicrobia bacterium]|nr:hypothetical protein [Verrucomicrobiota bacterium]
MPRFVTARTQSNTSAALTGSGATVPLWYYFGLAFVFLSAAYLRLRLPYWPVADRDTWGYLHPALSKLSGAVFQHTNSRNFLYPAFLLLVLRATNDFRAITIIQQLLGLATGGLLICAWSKTRALARHVSGHLHDALGLLIAALYLLARWPIEAEHEVRPEAIVPFFAILNIVLTLEFFEKRRRPGTQLAVTGAAVLLNSILLVTLRTSFALSILFSVIPVVIVLFDRRVPSVQRIAVLGMSISVAGIVTFTEQKLAASDPAARAFLPESLFCIHAKLIARQMDEDVARGKCGPYSCDWLRQVSASLHEELAKSWAADKKYWTLGFNPDYLKYGDSLHRWRQRFFQGNYNKQLEFYSYYFVRMLRAHPLRMLHKVVTQLRLFYTEAGHGFATSHTVDFARRYRESLAALPPALILSTTYRPFFDYLNACRKYSSMVEVISQSLLVRRVNGVLDRLYTPVVFVALVIIVLLPGYLRRDYRIFSRTVLFAYSYNFGNCLGIAIVHSLHVDRYLLAQYSFTLLSECIGLLFLVDVSVEAYLRSRAR